MGFPQAASSQPLHAALLSSSSQASSQTRVSRLASQLCSFCCDFVTYICTARTSIRCTHKPPRPPPHTEGHCLLASVSLYQYQHMYYTVVRPTIDTTTGGRDRRSGSAPPPPEFSRHAPSRLSKQIYARSELVPHMYYT